MGVISESKDGRKYWNKLKQRLKDGENEMVTICHQLKLKANDGKYRMTDVEVALLDLGEIATREIAKRKSPKGLSENIEVAKRGGKIALNTRKDLENDIGESIVTNNNNNLTYEYLKQNQSLIK